MQITFTKEVSKNPDSVVIGCFDKNVLADEVKTLDKDLQKSIPDALEQQRFRGNVGETASLTLANGTGALRVLVVGLGKKEDLDAATFERIGGHLFSALKRSRDEAVEVRLDSLNAKGLESGETLAHVAFGAQLKGWYSDKYKVKKKLKKADAVALKKLSFLTSSEKEAKAAFGTLAPVAEGVFFARDLVTEPANVLYPETMAKRLKELEKLGVKVEVLGEKELEKLGMGSLLSVGRGSDRESKVVVMQWNGGKAKDAPVAFIGKGVTFDTGGISLKPPGGMWDMKYDMAGAGAVSGLMKALAGRKAKVNAVGVVGLVENMVSGSATRPGDVVTSMSGQTIEILNTDAEGRLVLADVLWYTQDRFKPQFMVNLATLTGAILVALGSEYAGLFSNNDALSQKLLKSGEKTAELLWRFPLSKAFDKMLDSDIADMKNITTGLNGRKAGSITAGQFLQRFVNDVPWAHLDIAGMAWADVDFPTCARGATGFGVRLLNNLVRDHYEGS